MDIPSRTISLLVVLHMCCAGSLQAENYTIDFNRGTLVGIGAAGISTSIGSGTNPELFCKSGAEYVTIHEATSGSFYDNKGCGIRIGSNTKDGRFVLTLGTAAVYVSKIVVYASKISGNTTSSLTIKGGSVFSQTIGNSELQDYSPSFPASVNYVQPEFAINASFVNLQFLAPKEGYVLLHQIDVTLSETPPDDDAVGSPLAVPSCAEATTYNLAGQRISTPSRGIYIKGGRKFVAK